MAGPPKRSNAHKKAVGSRKMHDSEDLTPPLLSSVPEIPTLLEKSSYDYGRDEWDRICSLLISEEMLTEWDLPTIRVMCLEWERYCVACDDIEENGEYMKTSSGYEQVRPAHTIRNKAFGHYEKLLQRVGGDVVSRSKMKRVKPQENKGSKFDDI